jgi:hypothetical protein
MDFGNCRGRSGFSSIYDRRFAAIPVQTPLNLEKDDDGHVGPPPSRGEEELRMLRLGS